MSSEEDMHSEDSENFLFDFQDDSSNIETDTSAEEMKDNINSGAAKPYMYEPEDNDTGSDTSYHSAVEEQPSSHKKKVLRKRKGGEKWWCKCNRCVEMKKEKACVCCHDLPNLPGGSLAEGECITDSQEFAALTAGIVLTNVLTALNDVRGNPFSSNNR